jgi:hypothetical protein
MRSPGVVYARSKRKKGSSDRRAMLVLLLLLPGVVLRTKEKVTISKCGAVFVKPENESGQIVSMSLRERIVFVEENSRISHGRGGFLTYVVNIQTLRTLLPIFNACIFFQATKALAYWALGIFHSREAISQVRSDQRYTFLKKDFEAGHRAHLRRPLSVVRTSPPFVESM